MTKRFTLETEYNYIGLPVAKVIQDNLTGKKGYSIHDMIDFANEIYEEIQELKEENQKLRELLFDPRRITNEVEHDD